MANPINNSALVDRDLVVTPLTNAEINTLLAEYVAATVGADAMTIAFAKGLQSLVGNRHILAREVAAQVSLAHGGASGLNPTAAQEPLNKNQFGASDTFGTRYPA